MKKNKSPWIHQLDKERVFSPLGEDLETEIAVVGAGIAGVSTCFFLLENTDKDVVLLEGGKLAHGATGHNAGQITSYFERSLSDIADEFGVLMAKAGQEAIESAWELLDEMYTRAGLDIPMSRFLGHAGIVDLEVVLQFLKDNHFKKTVGLQTEEIFVSDDFESLGEIPEEFSNLYRIVPQEDILGRLETRDRRFIASASKQKGCLNSALFCQEVMAYLLKSYSDRVKFFENTHIGKIVLRHDSALLDAGNHTLKSEKVILCTNGFENMHILNESGLDIDTRYHHDVRGVIGFMSGYLKPLDKPPTAISYIYKSDSELDGEYFYLTRRQFEYEGSPDLNLISIGGPEIALDERSIYTSERDYPEVAEKSIDDFARNIFEGDSEKQIDYIFRWHGLMGYTTNKIRLIGEEPKNHVLLYNLGCNGIGILPSIYGGKRISRIIAGEQMELSIFDPRVGV